jgi:AcrR family transcriptional regulator
MSVVSQPVSRRERNKRQKLQRIIAAASELFAEHGVDDVTTQQIADAADIGTGTLFLYAKTKGELLLLVQNAHYADALERGRTNAHDIADVLDAVMAIVRPVVECNRVQVDNGRTYLREMVFGDPTDHYHAQALAIVADTEQAIGNVLRRVGGVDTEEADTLAHVVSAVMFLSMVAPGRQTSDVDEIVHEIRQQLRIVLRR